MWPGTVAWIKPVVPPVDVLLLAQGGVGTAPLCGPSTSLGGAERLRRAAGTLLPVWHHYPYGDLPKTTSTYDHTLSKKPTLRLQRLFSDFRFHTQRDAASPQRTHLGVA